MNPLPADDLAVLRERISRMETELAVTKQMLARLAEPVSLPPVLAPEPAAEPPLLPPVPPPLPPVGRPAPAARARPMRDWLTQVHLWPPRDEGDAEVRLGAWWATRLGALLAVIGIVFFGVYVSRNTPAAVKLGELVVVAVGVFLAGLWSERRVPTFGRVLTGAGLALFYFAAVAAYALPATRVIEEPWTAAITQLLAVLLLVGVAAWRRSEAMAVLAIAFGFATALATAYWGLGNLVWGSSLGLAVVAAGLNRKTGWRSVVVVAMPLVYLVYLVWGHVAAGDSPLPGPTAVWLPLLAAYLVFVGSDAPAIWRGRQGGGRDCQWRQGCNASAGIVAGALVTWWLLPDWLELFYFGAAGVLVLSAWLWRRDARLSVLVAILLIQAAGITALGLFAHFEGPMRWLVLLAEACVLLVAARASGLQALRIVFYVVWVWALFLFARTVGVERVRPLASMLVFLGASSVLLGFEQRWFDAKRALGYLGGALLGLVAWRTGFLFHGTGWSPAWLAGLAMVLVSGGWPGRAWRGPAVAAGLVLLGAHLAMAFYAPRSFPPWQFWTNAGALAGAVVLVGVFWDSREREPGAAGLGWRAVLASLAAVVAAVVFWNGLRQAQGLTGSAALAVLLAALSPWARRWSLTLAGTVGLACGLALQSPWRVRPDFPLLFAAAALAWVLPVLWQRSPVRRELIRGPWWRAAAPWIQATLATWIMVLAVRSNYAAPLLFLVTAAEAVAVFVLAWKLGVRPAGPASSVLLLLGAWWTAAALWQGSPEELTTGDGLALGAVLGLAAVLLLLPVLARSFAAGAWRSAAAWMQGAVALGLMFWLFEAQTGWLGAYTTVIWGMVAIIVFVLGLFLRERAYRLLGLAGLLLCLPRMFLVDLHSTLYRILAFVGLGVVMLWVGFSYHRFRHFVTGDAAGASSPPAE
ncbi:MAG: hypothetical protein ACHQ4G_03850 [Opitutales bacterium]